MTAEKIRLGIVGCGRVALAEHLPVLRRLPLVSLQAVADSDPDRLRQLGSAGRGICQFTDYRDLLENSSLDALAIMTPPASHIEIALAALEAGKHVLIEKPLGLNLEECDQLLARAAALPLTTLTGFNLRWHRLVQQARTLIQGGGLGQICAVHSVFTHPPAGRGQPAWHAHRSLGGGALLNAAIHHFDLWRYLLKCEVESIYCVCRSNPRYQDATSTVTAQLSQGILATGLFAHEVGAQNEITVLGEKGRLQLSLYRADGFKLFAATAPPGGLASRLKEVGGLAAKMPAWLQSHRAGGDFRATYQGLWAHFIAAIRRQDSLRDSLIDGRASLEIALAAAESANRGKPVALPGICVDLDRAC